MRQVVLDTETTGLEPTQGHRIIEIGCVELNHRRVTERTFHSYVNPDREVEAGAFEVHGISQSQLADKPRFAEVAAALLDFVRGAEVIIHNAPFDVAFLDAELGRLGTGWGRFSDHCSIVDSLLVARERHPGQKNSLDALCARYNVDNSGRDLHGALLDARLLADVYLAMTGGQAALFAEAGQEAGRKGVTGIRKRTPRGPGRLVLVEPSKEELDAHARRLEKLQRESDGRCVWLEPDRPRD